MGAQTEERYRRFLDKYEVLGVHELELFPSLSVSQNLKSVNEEPFMYGTHYSNIGSVLHFLVRMEPFSSYLIEFQGGQFDVRSTDTLCHLMFNADV